jgi:hypothetical protein
MSFPLTTKSSKSLRKVSNSGFGTSENIFNSVISYVNSFYPPVSADILKKNYSYCPISADSSDIPRQRSHLLEDRSSLVYIMTPPATYAIFNGISLSPNIGCLQFFCANLRVFTDPYPSLRAALMRSCVSSA